MNDTWKKELKEFLNTTFSIGTEKIELYIEALTHSGNNVFPNNQRLAFLGDAVLELIIRDHYFREHPSLDRGLLSNECDIFVNRKKIAKIAIKLEIVNCMHIENPPPDFKTNTKINEEVFEALFGALYLDHGLDKARDVAQKLRII